LANTGHYQVSLANCSGSTNSQIATLTVTGGATPPSITQQPASVSTNHGASVAFTVTATGTAPLAYQWSSDGTPIPNATGFTLILDSVQPYNAGSYFVTVTNVAGSATSSNALLIVNIPPGIAQQPVSFATNRGANVAFIVGATGTAPLAYQWQFDGVSITGETNSALFLSDVQINQSGS